MTAGEPLIELTGQFSHAQCRELLRAVEVAKTVLFQLGGESPQTDATIEERLSRLSFWEQTLQNKLT